MKNKWIEVSFIFLILVSSTIAFSDDRKANPPTLRIGFSESYDPWPGFTLASKYSKLKTYLEQEFSATVESVTTGWDNLSQYDVFIIPGRFQTDPPEYDAVELRKWLKAGGCLILIWYPFSESPYDAGSDKDWPANRIHHVILQSFGIATYATETTTNDLRTIQSPYDNNPYTVDDVTGDVKTCRVRLVPPTGNPQKGKFLAWNSSGDPVAAYHDKAKKGTLFFIGNCYAFQDYLIDSADNKNFIFNLIHSHIAANGGGGGKQPDLQIKFVKGRPRQVEVNDQIAVTIKIKNKGKATSDPTTVYIYFSPDKDYDVTDQLLGSADVPSINKKKRKKINKTVLVPNVAAGKWYVIAYVDKDSLITDADRTNNVKASNKAIAIE